MVTKGDFPVKPTELQNLNEADLVDGGMAAREVKEFRGAEKARKT
jgi:hypothetical protein